MKVIPTLAQSFPAHFASVILIAASAASRSITGAGGSTATGGGSGAGVGFAGVGSADPTVLGRSSFPLPQPTRIIITTKAFSIAARYHEAGLDPAMAGEFPFPILGHGVIDRDDFTAWIIFRD